MFYFHKGLSRQTCRTVGRALALAGREGCTAADTGHLLHGHAGDRHRAGSGFPARQADYVEQRCRDCTGSRSCTGTAPCG